MPDTNKIRLREDMRMNIIRAGFLDSGVSRIVDQVVEQKSSYIQSKVEEILYNYIGIEKPIKEEKKNGSIKDIELMPKDLEQISDKSSLNSMDMKEEIEEEVVDDFESPAFEPIEVTEQKNENTQGSNLSEISGLTSQDSLENKSGENEEPPPPGEEEIILEVKRDTELSQISTTTQDIIQEIEPQPVATALTLTGISGEEAQMAPSLNDSCEVDTKLVKNELGPQKSQFDLNKDVIEFTGTERKNITLDDSTNSGESEKALQPQDVQTNTMEIDNLYENDTTDSSEMKMEIDLKDESTQNTAASSKIEENSSQESLKEKTQKEQKTEKSRESHKSSHKSSRHHHSSSSSKSKHDKSRSSYKGSSDKKASSDKEKSSSSRKDRDKERKSETSRRNKDTDDHHQEKSTRRRRSTDHDSGDGKNDSIKTLKDPKPSEIVNPPVETKTESNNKPSDSPTSSKKAKEQTSSILVKYDYLKSSPTKSSTQTTSNENENEFHGFDNMPKSPHNPWYDVMDLVKTDQLPKTPKNNNYLKKDGTPARKIKAKSTKEGGECLIFLSY